MSQEVLFNFKIKKDTKKQMQKICKESGISMSAAFNIFAYIVVRDGYIPLMVQDSTLKTKAYLNDDKDELR